MTVGDLIRLLKRFPSHQPVIMSKDGEGNGFSPLAELGAGLYVKESDYHGHVFNLDERKEAGKLSCMAVVLWPTN